VVTLTLDKLSKVSPGWTAGSAIAAILHNPVITPIPIIFEWIIKLDSDYIFIQICGANHVISHKCISTKDTQLAQFNSQSLSEYQQTVT
jgi:hypothetical protein